MFLHETSEKTFFLTSLKQRKRNEKIQNEFFDLCFLVINLLDLAILCSMDLWKWQMAVRQIWDLIKKRWLRHHSLLFLSDLDIFHEFSTGCSQYSADVEIFIICLWKILLYFEDIWIVKNQFLRFIAVLKIRYRFRWKAITQEIVKNI